MKTKLANRLFLVNSFGYSCHGVEPIYEGGHGRSPFGIHCADGGDSSDGEDYSPFTIIDLGGCPLLDLKSIRIKEMSANAYE